VGRTGDIYIWDITDVNAPVFVDSITDPNSAVHNLYIVDDFAFVSYYAAGFRVFDVSDPTNPVLRNPLDEYDTSAWADHEHQGAWGVYPYDPRGYIYVSDRQNGLFVFAVEGFSVTLGSAPPPTFARISGKVTDTSGNNLEGIAIATARASCSLWDTFSTDANGAFDKIHVFGSNSTPPVSHWRTMRPV